MDTTTSSIQYTPPQGLSGPTNISKTAYIHNYLAPNLFCWKYTLHTTSSTIEYIPPLGPTGPTDISITANIHNCLPGGVIYSIIGYVVYKVYLKNNDRAHRQRHNCIYPFMFGLQISFWKLTLHTTSYIIGYIPPPGPTGPTDIGKTAYIYDCLSSKLFFKNWLCTKHLP